MKTKIDQAEMRLIASSGATFALTAAPDLLPVAGQCLVDIEFLDPIRRVTYLGRRVRCDFLSDLAEAWMSCAVDDYPELSVATVQDDTASLAVSVIGSSPMTVTLETLIVVDPEDPVIEHDGARFSISRASLITASQQLRAWVKGVAA